jgi:hypothetical protein
MLPKYWENITLLPTKIEQLEEFRKKFSGTFMFISSPKIKEKKLIRIVDVDIGAARVYASDVRKDVDYSFLYESDIELSFAFPSAKMLNVDNNIVYFSRHPARQYLRAPSTGNCSIFYPIPYMQHDLATVLLEAYAPTYFNLEEAVELLKTGDYIGRAINTEFALTLSFTSNDEYLLWYIDVVIAKLTKDGIVVIHDIFRQEVEDFLYRNRITKWQIKKH